MIPAPIVSLIMALSCLAMIYRRRWELAFVCFYVCLIYSLISFEVFGNLAAGANAYASMARWGWVLLGIALIVPSLAPAWPWVSSTRVWRAIAATSVWRLISRGWHAWEDFLHCGGTNL